MQINNLGRILKNLEGLSKYFEESIQTSLLSIQIGKCETRGSGFTGLFTGQFNAEDYSAFTDVICPSLLQRPFHFFVQLAPFFILTRQIQNYY